MFSDSLGGSLKPKKPAFKNRQVVDWNSCVGRCKRKQLALLLVISTTACLMKNSCLPFNGSFMRLWLRLARQSKQVWLKTKSRSGELTRQPILLIIGSFTLQTNTQILFSNKFGSHKSVTRVLQKGFLCPTCDILPQAGKNLTEDLQFIWWKPAKFSSTQALPVPWVDPTSVAARPDIPHWIPVFDYL